jgi:hypothetical protein
MFRHDTLITDTCACWTTMQYRIFGQVFELLETSGTRPVYTFLQIINTRIEFNVA